MAMKEEGNLLYKLKDFEAAEERYQLLLRSMSPTSKCIVASDFSVGQLVLIEFADTNSSSSIDVNFGIVSEVYKSDVDVIYDDVDTHSSLEAYHVPVKRLTMVSQDIGGRQIQRSGQGIAATICIMYVCTYVLYIFSMVVRNITPEINMAISYTESSFSIHESCSLLDEAQ